MPPSPLVPVTVVTGFLGAGKSTLVERWLEQLDDVAVIVNEAGEVGIDGALLASRVARLREITGGCVCCTTQAELAAALAELGESDPPPGRVLVETSGAASPAGVVRALTRGRAAERMRLDGIVTVLDVSRLERALSHDLTIEQLGFADVVVLSHVDRLEGPLDPIEARVAELAPAAVLAHGRRGALERTFAELLDERTQALRILPDSPARAHPIESVSLILDGALDEARFGDWVESALGDVEARLLRIKGILAMEGVDERVVLQGVGEAVEITLGAPWGESPRSSRLVLLGLGLDAAALEAGFAACAAACSAPGDQ